MTDLRALLLRLSLEDKVSLLTGADFWTLPPLPQIGLDALVLSDGPAGVRGTAWDERDTSLLLPCPAALGATWDTGAVELAGRLLGAEARRKGVHVLLAPTLNLQRAPLGGRHFECFSEDAFLAARLAVAYVRGVQSCGVAATAKHFVGNDSENGRMTYDSRIPPEQLRETYLLPFEAAVKEAGVWAVMAAYNGVGGTTMTEHGPLLTGILKQEWGFDGVVMSDWMATRSTHASAAAGLDLVMPGPDGPWGPALVEAVKAGELPESVVDDKVLRILRLAARVGALKAGAPPPVPADPPIPSLRHLAAEGMVLLHNASGMLPLDQVALRKVALIGPNAVALSAQGGGSAHVNPATVSNVADGLRVALDGVELTVHTGVQTRRLLPAPDPARCEVEFLGDSGTVLRSETRDSARLVFVGDIPAGTTSIRVTASLDITEPGTHQLCVIGVGAYTLRVGGRVHEFTLQAGGDDPAAQLMRPGQGIASLDLARGPVDIQITHTLNPGAPFASLGWGHLPPHLDDDAELAAAEAAASTSDVAIVVVGTNDEVESEGFDRETLALPGRQDELVRRVAAANPRTIVVVNGGAPVLMPWRDEVAAVLWAWLPGQEGGMAIADVLLGRAEPGGRLPMSLPADPGQVPVLSTNPVEGVIDYSLAPLTGYRAMTRPAFPFGHGLGYTTWSYDSVSVTAGDGLEVAVTVTNTGDRRGKEVVQCYLPAPSRLAGFAVVHADPGETTTARIHLSARTIARYRDGAWQAPQGPHRIQVGPSALDTRLEANVTFSP